MHRSIEHQGMMEMAPMAQIAIVAHSSLNFAATGYHFMLMQAKRKIAPGDTVHLKLEFSDGETLDTPFAVKPPSQTK